jgi:hypothetical protein
MIAQDYRFQLENNTGQSITSYDLKVERWKVDSSNALSYEGTSMTALETNATVTDGSFENTAAQDNGTNKYLGGHGHVDFVGNASADGIVVVRLQYSHDGGTSWPTDGDGIAIASWHVTDASTYSTSFEF